MYNETQQGHFSFPIAMSECIGQKDLGVLSSHDRKIAASINDISYIQPHVPEPFLPALQLCTLTSYSSLCAREVSSENSAKAAANISHLPNLLALQATTAVPATSSILLRNASTHTTLTTLSTGSLAYTTLGRSVDSDDVAETDGALQRMMDLIARMDSRTECEDEREGGHEDASDANYCLCGEKLSYENKSTVPSANNFHRSSFLPSVAPSPSFVAKASCELTRTSNSAAQLNSTDLPYWAAAGKYADDESSLARSLTSTLPGLREDSILKSGAHLAIKKLTEGEEYVNMLDGVKTATTMDDYRQFSDYKTLIASLHEEIVGGANGPQQISCSSFPTPRCKRRAPHPSCSLSLQDGSSLQEGVPMSHYLPREKTLSTSTASSGVIYTSDCNSSRSASQTNDPMHNHASPGGQLPLAKLSGSTQRRTGGRARLSRSERTPMRHSRSSSVVTFTFDVTSNGPSVRRETDEELPAGQKQSD